MLQIGLEIERYVRIFFTFVLLLTASTAVVADGCDAGKSAETILLPGSWRGFATADAAQWLRFTVGSPAVVTLDATVPLTELGEAVLTVVGADCQPQTEGFAHLERAPSHQVLIVSSPGEYFIRITPADPRRPLRYVIVNLGLVAELGAIPFTKDTVEIEIDPDGLTACLGELDDHGDTESCPTPLEAGRRMLGSLGNVSGDDVDVFRFTLAEPRIVHLKAHGEAAMVGGLFHRDGHRLAVDHGGEAGFRIVKALGPGRYFVRIEGLEVAEQAYGLSLTTRGW